MPGLPSSGRRRSPAHNRSVDALARFGAPPIVIPPTAQKRKHIGADVILAEEFARDPDRWRAVPRKSVEPPLP